MLEAPLAPLVPMRYPSPSLFLLAVPVHSGGAQLVPLVVVRQLHLDELGAQLHQVGLVAPAETRHYFDRGGARGVPWKHGVSFNYSSRLVPGCPS